MVKFCGHNERYRFLQIVKSTNMKTCQVLCCEWNVYVFVGYIKQKTVHFCYRHNNSIYSESLCPIQL